MSKRIFHVTIALSAYLFRHQVERLLDSVDAVVYILDYTKLKTAEEALLLCKIREANPALVQRLAQRLFFVVNKVDQMYENDGLQEQELREYVAGLITSQLNTEAFQLKPEQASYLSSHSNSAPSTLSGFEPDRLVCSGHPLQPA